LRFVIPGEPVTKKTNQRVFKRSGGGHFLVPSKKTVSWTALAIACIQHQWQSNIDVQWVGPIHVRALFYRSKNFSDLDNLCSAVGDALQRSGAIANDKLIHSWDGSRKLIDKLNPRVEVEVLSFEEGE
jgi:Holliday junction resolvase RusA-like endonuclease